MKYILLIFMIAFTEFALSQGDAPPLLQGQLQLSKSVGSFIQSPNVSVTKISSSTALIETGNKNILTNPSFEHSTAMTGWTNSAGGAIVNNGPSSVVIEGKKSIVVALSSQILNFFQDSSLYSTAFDGVQGLASVRILTSVQGLRVCSRQAGVVSPSLCVNIQANGKWGLYKVPFILGGTSNGISINSNGSSVSGNVYIDDAFVGAVDLQATVDSSKLAGESYFAGTSGCTWTRTSSTIGSFSTTAACPGPTVAYSSMGQWQTTDADLPRQTINNLPPGVYKATFTGTTSQSVGGVPAYSINDGTTTCEAIGAESSTTNSSSVVVSCTFIYNSSGNRTFELYTGSSTNTVSLFNGNATPRASLKFQLEYFGSGTTYSSTNANFWGRTYSPTITADSGALSNFTSTATYGRTGNKLFVKGRITFTGASTAFTCPRIGLPENLTLATSDSEIIGDAVFTDISATRYVKMDTNALIGLTNSIRISYPVTNTGTNPQSLNYTCPSATDPVTIASGDYFDYSFEVPVSEWDNSNIIIGQFNGLESCTNSYECTDVFSAKVSAAGVVSGENIDWINGNCTMANPVNTCQFKASLFTVAPNCIVVLDDNTLGTLMTKIANPNTSATQVGYVTQIAGSNTYQAEDVNIICQKQGADYIGKTAKAVASDQNLSTPGTTKSTMCSAKISSTGVISDQKGGCFASCTNATMPVCTFTSNYWVSGQVPNCWHVPDFGAFLGQAFTTSTTFSGNIYNSASIGVAGARIYFCHGERQ